MPSSLGIHIENDVIKYAKIRKEKDLVKVEAFNVVFYEDLKSTIRQIITETNSNKIPIVTNLSDETYNYFQISSLMNKQDMKKAIELEFDLLCDERNIKKNTLETRYLFAPSTESTEKMQGIAISGNQADIVQKKMCFENFKISSIHPLSTTITNLINPSETANIAIINIEEKTKLTIMSNGEIVSIDLIDDGMRTILNKINMVENSKQKSYEVCKNTTLYTQDAEGNSQEGNEYLDSIIPTLYSIVTKTKEKIEDVGVNVSKIYITGMATSINNIDLYFQEYFEKARCEILRPFFANVSSIKTSIKDYIEVNSAIALALNGIGYGYGELNFLSTKAVSPKKVFKNTGEKSTFAGKSSFSGTFDAAEKLLVRLSITGCIALILFAGISYSITSKTDKKTEEVETKLAEVQKEIKIIDADIKKVSEGTKKYQEQIEILNNLDEKLENKRVVQKSSIPNLLYNLTKIIPEKVQILTLQNDKDSTHIVIEAQSDSYEQLGYFKAAIATEVFLTNVKSTSGTMSNNIITTIIEGDLP